MKLASTNSRAYSLRPDYALILRYPIDNDSNIQTALLWIRYSKVPSTLNTLLRSFIECKIQASNQARQTHEHLCYCQATKDSQFPLRFDFVVLHIYFDLL